MQEIPARRLIAYEDPFSNHCATLPHRVLGEIESIGVKLAQTWFLSQVSAFVKTALHRANFATSLVTFRW
jgi:hypothetical protein